MGNPFFWRFIAFTQKYRGRLLAVSSGGLFAASISYHAFPGQIFRRIYQGWSRGEPVELTGDLHRLFQDVLREVGVGSLSSYTPFAAFGFYPVSAGLPWLPGGCLIGIPANYDSASIVARVLMVNGKKVAWDSEMGQRLRDSLVLSADAQKFSLARDALFAQSNCPVIKAAVAPVCFSGVCLSGVAMKHLLGLYSGPVGLRALCNVAVVLLGFVGYFLCDDAVTQWLDFRTDRRAAAISKSYAEGGLEFYDKTLARNQVLRTLMGKQGETVYAPSGNLFPRNYFRLQHTPYTARRHQLQHALETRKE